MNQAQLITPEGKTIVLPEHIYFQAMEMLELEKASRPMPKEELQRLIKETMGSLSEGSSLTQALLQSRREDFEREEKRINARKQRLTAKHKRAA